MEIVICALVSAAVSAALNYVSNMRHFARVEEILDEYIIKVVENKNKSTH